MKRFLFPLLLLSLGLTLTSSFGGNSIWKLNPTSNDWNTADNWTPANIPNAPNDVAIFAESNVTDISVSASSVQVKEIIFDSSATSSFNISCVPQSSDRNQIFVISGAGLTNNSAFPQALTAGPKISQNANIKFVNAASAGNNTVLSAFRGCGMRFNHHSSAGSASLHAYGSDDGKLSDGGGFAFFDYATAGTATFTIHPATGDYAYGGAVTFLTHSTADHATFVVEPATTANAFAGFLGFYDESTAGDANITLVGPISGSGPELWFYDGSTGGNAVITANGGQKSGASGTYVYIYGYGINGLITSAGKATIILNGGTAPGAFGANMFFYNYASGGEARLIANGGINGGKPGNIDFSGTSDGGAAQVEVYDSANLDVSGRVDEPSITIGSLAGTGFVYTGSSNLTIGSNNLSTTFSGVIQEEGGFNGTNGTITKIGTGTLTLEGASTYDGGTTVSDGVLKVNNAIGSGTGSGPVQVDAGTLGGRGIVAGAVTLGTGSASGAFLQPGVGASTPTTLTIQQGLIFDADATYSCKLNTKKAKADQVIANGVTIQAGALFDLNTVGNKKLSVGKVFTAISNTATTPIIGNFANLPDGGTITVGSNTFQASYSGGDGNDLTLTVAP